MPIKINGHDNIIGAEYNKIEPNKVHMQGRQVIL